MTQWTGVNVNNYYGPRIFGQLGFTGQDVLLIQGESYSLDTNLKTISDSILQVYLELGVLSAISSLFISLVSRRLLLPKQCYTSSHLTIYS